MNDENTKATETPACAASALSAGLCHKPLSEETIKVGADLAQQALHFAIFNNGKVTAGECRKAIIVLFGLEVDAELDRRFIRRGA